MAASMRRAMMFFQEADADDSLSLDFEEFVAELPSSLRLMPHRELRRFFNLADKDGDGSITMSEFLDFSLEICRRVTGSDLQRLLSRGDPDESGIEEMKFVQAAREMGFSQHAETLFRHLPQHADGTIHIERLSARMRMPGAADGQLLRDFVIGMAWNGTKHSVPMVSTDTLRLSTGSAVAPQKLQALLDEKGVRLSQLFDAMDTSGDCALNEAEFVEGFVGTLGFTGGEALAQRIFRHIVGDDHTNLLTFDKVLACPLQSAVVAHTHYTRHLLPSVFMPHTPRADCRVRRTHGCFRSWSFATAAPLDARARETAPPSDS